MSEIRIDSATASAVRTFHGERSPPPSLLPDTKMGGKAKPTKHTAKEIAKKVGEATTNKGGGKAGLADRKGGAAGHAKFKCPSCGVQSPSIKSAEMHWDSKHPKLPFVPEDWSDMHAANGGVTTAGIAIKGAKAEKTIHQLAKTEAGREKLKQIEKAKEAAKF
jgi:hypothetical protein